MVDAPPALRLLTIDTARRRLLGAVLIGVALTLVLVAGQLDWALGIFAWITALLVLIPAGGLIQRRHLEDLGDARLLLRIGRRGTMIDLDGVALEILPTAGTCALLLHVQQTEIPVGTWLTRRRAETIASWIDEAARSPLTRRSRARHASDR